MNAPTLQINRITKRYENHLALDRVSLSVPNGAIYGLLGPNGAGKTTLIRVINQITIPDEGEVLLNGRPITRADVAQIGYLPEERGLYKKMKVGEHLLYLAQLKGLDRTNARSRAEMWFERMEIENWWTLKIEELSKGMQQKIQFISTVIHDPKLLIFDEPFSGFDPINASLLKQQIEYLKERGTTIILSTHNMESVESLCDEISLINQSRVVLQGKVADIRSRFKESVFVLSVKPSRQTTAIEPTTVPKQPLYDRLETPPSGEGTLRIRKREAMTNSDLLVHLSKQYEIDSFNEELPSMNDIFIRVVKTAQ